MEGQKAESIAARIVTAIHDVSFTRKNLLTAGVNNANFRMSR
jgi:hypothetical protein